MGVVLIIIFCVGFCVARSATSGNARASGRGMGNGTDSHAFSFYVRRQLKLLFKNTESGESAGRKQTRHEEVFIEFLAIPRDGIVCCIVHFVQRRR